MEWQFKLVGYNRIYIVKLNAGLSPDDEKIYHLNISGEPYVDKFINAFIKMLKYELLQFLGIINPDLQINDQDGGFQGMSFCI